MHNSFFDTVCVRYTKLHVPIFPVYFASVAYFTIFLLFVLHGIRYMDPMNLARVEMFSNLTLSNVPI